MTQTLDVNLNSTISPDNQDSLDSSLAPNIESELLARWQPAYGETLETKQGFVGVNDIVSFARYEEDTKNGLLKLIGVNKVSPRGIFETYASQLFAKNRRPDTGDAEWNGTNLGLTKDQSTGPDGTALSAGKALASGAGSIEHFFSQSISATIALRYAFSVVVEVGNTDWVFIESDVTGSLKGAWYNVNTVKHGTIEAGVDFVRVRKIKGTNFIRCDLRGTADATEAKTFRCHVVTQNNERAYVQSGEFVNIGWTQLTNSDVYSSLGDHATAPQDLGDDFMDFDEGVNSETDFNEAEYCVAVCFEPLWNKDQRVPANPEIQIHFSDETPRLDFDNFMDFAWRQSDDAYKNECGGPTNFNVGANVARGGKDILLIRWGAGNPGTCHDYQNGRKKTAGVDGNTLERMNRHEIGGNSFHGGSTDVGSHSIIHLVEIYKKNFDDGGVSIEEFTEGELRTVYEKMKSRANKIGDDLLTYIPLNADSQAVLPTFEPTPADEVVDVDGTFTDPITGAITDATLNKIRIETKGALFEKDAKNFFKKHDKFDVSPWATSADIVVTDISGTIESPNGKAFVIDDTGAIGSFMNQTIGVSYTTATGLSAFLVKKGTSNTFRILIRDASAAVNRTIADFEWQSGVPVETANAGGTSYVVEHKFKKGFYWVVVVSDAILVPANSHLNYFYPNFIGTNAGETGTTILSAAQAEDGKYLTSLIKSDATVLERTFDVLTYSNLDEQLMTSSKGSIIFAYTPLFNQDENTTNKWVFSVGTDNDNRFGLFVHLSLHLYIILGVNAGVVQFQMVMKTLDNGKAVRGQTDVLGFTWEKDSFKSYHNGVFVASDLLGTLNIKGILAIGNFFDSLSSSSSCDGNVGEFRTYKQVLDASQMLSESQQVIRKFS